METITSADGTTIGYEATGSGPPLLLVHGTTADHTRWAGILPQLQQHFTVHAMDRRGRGASTDDPEGYDILREAGDVAAVVDAIGQPVDVVGHSYGAVCSLEAAVLTDSIRRLVLYEPPLPTGVPMYPPGLPDRMQALIDDGELEGALELFFREVVRMPDHELVEYRELPVWKQRIQLAPTIPREMAIDRSYSFDPKKFADLGVSVLLMLGGDSPPIFPAAIEAADAALPDSRVVVLPGQQHIAMDTNPELFLSEVRDFLVD
jgi:pimeloyl-ACP methyl ester carboxylesterase